MAQASLCAAKMMSMAPEYRPIRVPREHGGVYVDPAFGELESVLAFNRRLRTGYELDFAGVSYQRLADQARCELVHCAVEYTAAYRDVSPQPPGRAVPILLAGHQPQLFHPGVWFKNFALSSLARRVGGIAVNLLVDNDILRNSAIRCPTADRRVVAVPFDHSNEPVAFEERGVLDMDMFQSFGRRVEETLGGLVEQPIIRRLWPWVLEALGRDKNVGRAIAQARHRLEADWDQQTFELPLSDICRGEAFRRFAAHLIAHLPRFREIHNSSLAEYRRLNRVRSRSHPVPDLATDGPWLEAPFWIWSRSVPHRRHLFVRDSGGRIELSDRNSLRVFMNLSPGSEADEAINALAEAEATGLRIRPRALITTMYARLMLSDLFLHGIGGAKYDQLTDLIIHRFFGVVPPRYFTISATALLFDDRTAELTEAIRKTKLQLRELDYHPEHYAEQNDEVAALTDQKRRWIATELPRRARRSRHEGIVNANLMLQPFVTELRRELLQRRQRLETELRQHAPLASREFSFCLFPEPVLRPLLLDLCR